MKLVVANNPPPPKATTPAHMSDRPATKRLAMRPAAKPAGMVNSTQSTEPTGWATNMRLQRNTPSSSGRRAPTNQIQIGPLGFIERPSTASSGTHLAPPGSAVWRWLCGCGLLLRPWGLRQPPCHHPFGPGYWPHRGQCPQVHPHRGHLEPGI